MAKKTDSFADTLKGLFGTIADIGLNTIIGTAKSAAHETMQEAQRKIEESTVRALKAATIFILMIFGLILVVVGFGSWLSNTVPSLAGGLGHVVVGAGIMGLGLLIQFFKS